MKREEGENETSRKRGKQSSRAPGMRNRKGKGHKTHSHVMSHHITAQPPPLPPPVAAEAPPSSFLFFLIFLPDIHPEPLPSFFPGKSTTTTGSPAARLPPKERGCSSTPFLFRLKKPSLFALTVVGKAAAAEFLPPPPPPPPPKLACRL